MDFLKYGLDELTVKRLKHEDAFFLDRVMIDVRSYLNVLKSSSEKREVLIFPPLNNFRRFLIHQLIQKTFGEANLTTLSIGIFNGRRTVVCTIRQKLTTEKNVNSLPPTRSPSIGRTMSNASDSKTRRTRKPDIQIYVPRGRRMLQTSQDKADLSTESFGELDTQREKNLCDAENYSVTALSTSPTSTIKLDDDEEIHEVDSCDTSHDSNCDIKNSQIDDVIDITEDSQDFLTNQSDTKIVLSDDSECEIIETSIDCGISKKNKIQAENEATVPIACSTTATTSKAKGDDNNKVNSKSTNGVAKASECDWEELFDDSGHFLDESLVDELIRNVGKVKIQGANQDYQPFQSAEERTADGQCIIEVHNFPADFTTEDLLISFANYRSDQGFQIVWVDDTHALAVFSSPMLADQALNSDLPFVKTRPLKQATPKSRMRARTYVPAPVSRPKTCVSLARRLVSGHLGMKINVTEKQREAERKMLSDAREQRRQIAKQKYDAWEGTSSSER